MCARGAWGVGCGVWYAGGGVRCGVFGAWCAVRGVRCAVCAVLCLLRSVWRGVLWSCVMPCEGRPMRHGLHAGETQMLPRASLTRCVVVCFGCMQHCRFSAVKYYQGFRPALAHSSSWLENACTCLCRLPCEVPEFSDFLSDFPRRGHLNRGHWM